MGFTVTATQGGATAVGTGISLYIVSGQLASQPGSTATASALSTSLTAQANGSLVFGSVLATPGTLSPLAGTTLIGQTAVGGLTLGSLVSTSATTGGGSVTYGVTSSGGAGISVALLEILAAGGLSPFAGNPAGLTGAGATSVTSPAVSPPGGSLLVAMVQSNGAVGVTTISISDTSGYGLSWVERVKLNPSGSGYAGVWTAAIPAVAPTSVFGQPVLGISAVSDSAGYTLGMQFSLTQAAPLTGIWFYSGNGATVLPTGCCIFQMTGSGTGTVVPGTENDSPSWSGAAASGWVKCSYSGSVVLAAGTSYKVAIFKPGGSTLVYSAITHYWDGTGTGAGGLVGGILSAPNNASGDGGQDTFITGVGVLTYPNTSFNASNYLVDVEVTPFAPAGPAPFSFIPPGFASPAAFQFMTPVVSYQVSGGTVNPLSLTGQLAGSGSVLRAAGRIFACLAVVTSLVSRVPGKLISAGCAVSASAAKSTAKAVTAIAAITPGLIKAKLLSLSAPVAAVSRSVLSSGKQVTAQAAFMGSLNSVSRKILQVPVAVAAAILRLTIRNLNVITVLTSSASQVKAKLLTATAGIFASTGMRTRKILTSVSAFASTAVRARMVTLAAAIRTAGSVTTAITGPAALVIFKLGVPAFRWITGTVFKNWRSP